MPLFHRHKFEEKARKFSSPQYTVKDPGEVTVTSQEMLRLHQEYMLRLMTGFTTVELRCIECGDIKFIITSGDQTEPASTKSV